MAEEINEEEICNEYECFQSGTPGCECYDEGICTSCEKYFPEDDRTVQESGTFCHECWEAYCQDEWERAMADQQYYASR